MLFITILQICPHWRAIEKKTYTHRLPFTSEVSQHHQRPPPVPPIWQLRYRCDTCSRRYRELQGGEGAMLPAGVYRIPQKYQSPAPCAIPRKPSNDPVYSCMDPCHSASIGSHPEKTQESQFPI